MSLPLIAALALGATMMMNQKSPGTPMAQGNPDTSESLPHRTGLGEKILLDPPQQTRYKNETIEGDFETIHANLKAVRLREMEEDPGVRHVADSAGAQFLIDN